LGSLPIDHSSESTIWLRFTGNPLGRILACAGLAPVWFWLLCGCSTTFDLGSNDAGVRYDADCAPGTYTGNYACVTTDGSPFAQGVIAVSLEPIGTSTLALTPDASIETTTSSATATSPLTGVLDCPTRKLRGTFGPVLFMSGSFQGAVSQEAAFSALYDPDASPPALIDGEIDLPSDLGSTCAWMAELK
jgi:hypothetical protein